nr:MAG TPA: hypothetical protein [Caudoviricetes sp.]
MTFIQINIFKIYISSSYSLCISRSEEHINIFKIYIIHVDVRYVYPHLEISVV